MQMFEGNIIAWLAFSGFITVVVLIVLLGIVWWKMPQPARKLFKNNLFGQRPVIADAYDNKVVRFETPTIFREGIMYDKDSGCHFHPRLTSDAKPSLNQEERELINKTFSIQGAPGQFYLAYSGKGIIVNPELQAVIEHASLFKRDKKKSSEKFVYVKRKVLIDALQELKDDMIKIKPVWITTLLDPRKIKEYLSKTISSSQLYAHEVKIRADAQKQFGGVGAKGILVLSLITLAAVVAVAVKVFELI